MPLDTYSISETTPPPNYTQATATQTGTLTRDSTCDQPEFIRNFYDTPLSLISVTFQSLNGPGITQGTLQCSPQQTSPVTITSGVPITFSNVLPGTYNCTVVIVQP